MKKLTIKRGADFPALSASAALIDATQEELRVLLCLIEAVERGLPTEAEAIASAAAVSAARAASSLRYWAEVGVLTEETEAAQAAAPTPATGEEEKAAPPAEPSANWVAERRMLTGEETAAVVEREQMAAFIDACQQLAGRVFSTPDVEMLVSLCDELPFSHEYMMTLASFCKRRSGRARFSVRYLSKVAYSMLERECLTVEQLEAYIAAYEKFSGEEWKLRKLFGMGERKLSQREQEYFLAWTGFGYGEEVVGIAYDIAVDRTGKASLPYIDKLVRAFHAAGCQSEADVQRYLERERQEHAAKKLTAHAGGQTGKKEKTFSTGKSGEDASATGGSSFRSKDYMAAALRRSYGDDGEG
jgi:hypothetical protein